MSSTICFVKPLSKLFLFLSIIFGLILSSCENCTFISDNVQFAAVSFYNENGTAITKELESLKITGIFARTGDAMPNPLFGENDEGGQILELPIFTRADTTIYAFEQYVQMNNVLDTLYDTMALRYKVFVEVLPPDCGYDEAITDVEVLYSTFENVEVVQTELKELQDRTPHIKIFE